MEVLEIFHWPTPDLSCSCLESLGTLKQNLLVNFHYEFPPVPLGPLGPPPALAGLKGCSPWEPEGRGEELKILLQPWEWHLLRTWIFQLPDPEGHIPINSWVNPYKVKTEHLLCVDTLLLGVLLSLFSEERFLLKNVVRNLKCRFQPAVFLIWRPFTALLCRCQKCMITSWGKKTYCQSLLILCNYTKIRKLPWHWWLVCLFVCFPFKSWRKGKVAWLFSPSIV